MGDAVVVGTAPGLARPRGRRSSLVGWTFLLPVIALNLVVIIGPAVASIYYSLTEWSGLGAPSSSASATTASCSRTRTSTRRSSTTSSGR